MLHRQLHLEEHLRPKSKILRVHVRPKQEHCTLLRMKLVHGRPHLKTSHGKLFELISISNLNGLFILTNMIIIWLIWFISSSGKVQGPRRFLFYGWKWRSKWNKTLLGSMFGSCCRCNLIWKCWKISFEMQVNGLES